MSNNNDDNIMKRAPPPHYVLYYHYSSYGFHIKVDDTEKSGSMCKMLFHLVH